MEQKIKGWKVFNSDLSCAPNGKKFQYEVGKTYEENNIRLCVRGFHFHTNPEHLFHYYSYTTNIRVCEIEASGDIINGDDKSVCSKITIIKELSQQEILELVNTGKSNSGIYNSGNCNSGRYNSGNYNSGRYNSGNCNSGHYNSGHYNSGNYNSGNYNSGRYNSGDCNGGNCNSGYCNSGNNNSGNYNSGDCNSGFFNTGIPPLRIFNKETTIDRNEIQWPRFTYNINLTEWIEDEENPEGYLKTYSYKKAWRNAWEATDFNDRKLVLKLPNWDNEIFKEITGIDAEAEIEDQKKSNQ